MNAAMEKTYVFADRAAWLLFLLFIFMLPMQFFAVKFQMRSVYACDFIFPPLFACWLFSRFKYGIRIPPLPVLAGMALVAVSLLVSTVFSREPARSVSTLAGKAYLASAMLLAFDMIRGDKRVKQLLLCFSAAFACVVVCGLAGIALFYLGSECNPFIWSYYGQLPPGAYPRLTGPFETPQELALYLSIHIFAALGARKYFYETSQFFRKAFPFVAAASAPVAFFSLSRDLFGIFTGILTYMTAARIFAGRFGTPTLLFVAEHVLALFAVLIVSTTFFVTPLKFKFHANDASKKIEWDLTVADNGEETRNGFIDETLVSVNAHAHERVCFTVEMMNVLRERPLTGAGPGVVGSPPSTNIMHMPRDMHNTYRQLLVQQGWPGLAAALAFIAAVFYTCSRSVGRFAGRDLEMYLYIFAIFGAALGAAYFNHHLNNRAMWLAVACAAGIHAALRRKVVSEKNV